MVENSIPKILIPSVKVEDRERTFELTQEDKDFWNLYRNKYKSVIETTTEKEDVDVQKNPNGIEYILTRCDYKRADGVIRWTNWEIREDGNLIFITREEDLARFMFETKVKNKVKV